MGPKNDLTKIMKTCKVPKYVSKGQVERIMYMMDTHQIHPAHPGCDFTAELSAGVPLAKANYHLGRKRTESSIYDKVHKLYNK